MKKAKQGFFHWIFLLCLIIPSIAWCERLMLIQVGVSKGSHSAVIFSLTKKPVVYSYVLTHPDRIAIDFRDTQLGVNLQNTNLKGTFFKKIRSGYPDGKTLRLVFDLTTKVNFTLSLRDKTVILNTYLTTPKIKTSKRNATPVSVSPTFHNKPAITRAIKAPIQENITVVIDPGHGGQDPGAIGENGTQEKNVVLAIAKHLAFLINQNSHMRAVLTRDSDIFIPLADRLKLARKGKADLFIAIHADSYFNKQANGISVYALSRGGATSVAARWLSNRENHSELGGLNLKELEDQSLQLRSVLIDLAQTATIIDSLRLGTSLLKSLDDITQLHYARVEQAPFLVLKSPDIPSILVETGFLSNRKEEEKLRNPAYQRKIATAIFNGIQLYLKKYSSTSS